MSSAEIIIVSGLPRSGTSLMMQMLEKAGIDVLADHIRAADPDNPRGYLEFERVKKTKEDSSWLPAARGKAVKMISQHLYDLPSTESYRVLFMDRDLEETLASQEKMLVRRGQPVAPRERIREAYLVHLERLHEWLGRQPNFSVCRIRYDALMSRALEMAEQVRQFLGGRGDPALMAAAVDPALYRNRRTAEPAAP
jgi:RNase adaptor protein for sRNA GlmZ degradation